MKTKVAAVLCAVASFLFFSAGCGSQASPTAASAPTASVSSLLFAEDFENCASSYPDFSQAEGIGTNAISDARSGGVAHSGNCSSETGANGEKNGKLVTPLFTPSSDVWFSAYVYVPQGILLPACQPIATCAPGGIHFWRLESSQWGSGTVADSSFDFNVPNASATLQFYFYRGDGTDFAKLTTYNPADPSMLGKWQYWQLHVSLGTAGNSDGFARFYSDYAQGGQPVLVDSLENQAFLPAGAGSSYYFAMADVQSNIGGNPNYGWPTSPVQGWYLDDIRICSTNAC